MPADSTPQSQVTVDPSFSFHHYGSSSTRLSAARFLIRPNQFHSRLFTQSDDEEKHTALWCDVSQSFEISPLLVWMWFSSNNFCLVCWKMQWYDSSCAHALCLRLLWCTDLLILDRLVQNDRHQEISVWGEWGQWVQEALQHWEQCPEPSGKYCWLVSVYFNFKSSHASQQLCSDFFLLYWIFFWGGMGAKIFCWNISCRDDRHPNIAIITRLVSCRHSISGLVWLK